MKTHPGLAAVLFTVALAATALAAADTPDRDAFLEDIRSWREDREARLTSETGWLTVAGFFWLEPGDNVFGAGPGNPVVMPEGTGPDVAGVFQVTMSGDGFTVILKPAAGLDATVNGEPVSERVLLPDNPGPADKLQIGRVTLWVLKRNGKPAIRMRDPEYYLRREFTGIENYEANPGYRVDARFVRYDPPRELLVPNQLGHTDTTLAHGELRFALDGAEYALVPESESPQDSVLFLVFGDATTGEETYGGGRFLYATVLPGDRVVLDFNKAYNPPCALNPWTTCPLPPESNKLPIPVRAGEKMVAGPHDR